MEYLPVLRYLTSDIAGHRGATQGLLAGNETFRSKVKQREQNINKHFIDLHAVNKRLGSELGIDNKPNLLTQKWRKLINNTTLSASENFSKHSELITEIIGLMSTVANQSNLTLDPELDSYYLMDSIVFKLPMLAEMMGQVRGKGAGSIYRGELSIDLKLTLSILANRMEIAIKDLDNALATTYQNNATSKEHLQRAGNIAVFAIQDFIKLTNQELLKRTHPTITSADYFEQGTKAIEACFTLYDQVLPELDRLLLDRISKNKQNLTLALVTIAVILLIVLLVFSAVYIGLSEVINDLGKKAPLLPQGDLTARCNLSTKDELGDINLAMNSIANDFGRAIFNIKHVSDQLDQICGYMYDANQKNCNGVVRQDEELNMTAASITEMNESFQEVSNNTSNAASVAAEAKSDAENGLTVVNNVVKLIEQLALEVEKAGEVIHKLESDSNNITTILDTIRGIADQTNLLALNAAIEAARAGEQGRGFAVVADEVRTLAQRTQDATIEIQDMITHVQKGSLEATQVMQSGAENARHSAVEASGANDALQAIVSGVILIHDMNTQIATAAEKQSAVAEEINHNIINVNETSASTAKDANISLEASSKVRALSSEVHSLANRFIISEEQVEAGWQPLGKLFDWDDSYSLGIAEIDRQHQRLMALANEFNRTILTGAVAGTIERVLSGMIEYSLSHFQYEESLMEKYAYKDLANHKAEHQKLEKQVLQFQHRFECGEDISQDFSEFLKDWLLRHIKGMDQECCEHLKRCGVH
ncbi:MAG: bacteriohemerythrin [Psychromonas sp.]|nr:bacteriohemerythrin [Psychromonas sp.]